MEGSAESRGAGGTARGNGGAQTAQGAGGDPWFRVVTVGGTPRSPTARLCLQLPAAWRPLFRCGVSSWGTHFRTCPQVENQRLDEAANGGKGEEGKASTGGQNPDKRVGLILCERHGDVEGFWV